MRSLVLILTIIVALVGFAPGQDEKLEPVTTGDPAISLPHLKLKLDPLTVDELAAEAQGWRDLLKAAVTEYSETAIASEEGGDAEALAKLQERKTALSTRLTAVLDAWEAKGGDPESIRTYNKAVSGVKASPEDVGAQVSAWKGWLSSEDGGIKWAKNLGVFVAIMLVAWMISGIVAALVNKVVSTQAGFSDLLKKFIRNMTRRIILLFGLIVALSTLGVNVGALLALIGGGAFIIGFALQDTLGNFAAGLMLLVYRPFDVGDAVEVAGVSGKVDGVNLVSTRILTWDNKVVIVPNKSVWGQTITNATGSSERRVDLVFGIGYGDDIAKAQAILERLVAEHDLVLDDPEPTIKLNELADSSVNFICRPWSKTSDYWTVYWDLTRQVKEAFDAEGISIPFPQRDVHVHQVAARGGQ